MNVPVNGEAEVFIRKEVDSGRFDSPQAVVSEGLRLLAQLDRHEAVPGEWALTTAFAEASRKRREARPLEDDLDLSDKDLMGSGLTAAEIALSPELGAWAAEGGGKSGAEYVEELRRGASRYSW